MTTQTTRGLRQPRPPRFFRPGSSPSLRVQRPSRHSPVRTGAAPAALAVPRQIIEDRGHELHAVYAAFSADPRAGPAGLRAGHRTSQGAGGGALVVPICQGDRIAIVDREGRQRCEIAAFAADGAKTSRAPAQGRNGVRGRQRPAGGGERRCADDRGSPAPAWAARPHQQGRSSVRRRLAAGRDGGSGGGARLHRHLPCARRPDERRCAGRADRSLRHHQAGGSAQHHGTTAARAARRSARGDSHRSLHGPGLPGEGRRVHPDHRRRRPAMLRLPGLQRAPARQAHRALSRHDGDAQHGWPRLSRSRPLQQVLRSRPAAAGRSRT